MKGSIFVKIPAFCEFSLFCVFLCECLFFVMLYHQKNIENEKNWNFLFVINYYYGLKTSFLVAIPPTYLHYTINTIIFVRSKPKISENPRKSVKINENQPKSMKINKNVTFFKISREILTWETHFFCMVFYYHKLAGKQKWAISESFRDIRELSLSWTHLRRTASQSP